ncbi:MAG TPA: MBL fold metallo-hydrolase [Rectinemataceae bacterium]|nr:MBL fold metallo-hydrolase [Rectinemataceae bacterium]
MKEIKHKNDSPLSLINGGELSLTFIGSGSAFSKRFFQNNLLIVKGDTHVLVDCGTRTPEALTRLGLSVTTVRNYLITHTHADHIGGLEEVMLVNRYGPRQKPTMIVTERLRKILWSMSLRGGSAYNEEHDGRYLEMEDFWNFITPIPLRPAARQLCETRIGDIRIKLFRTMHIPDSARDWRSSFPSYGLIIDDRVLFTSDTRYDPQMVERFEEEHRFEAIFHDCQMFTGGVHASIEELAGLPEPIRAKTRLMHYGDNVDAFSGRITELGFAGLAGQWTSYVFDGTAARGSHRR